MSKILTTQLTGLLQRIEKGEEDIFDSARLLAQAAVGEGTVYFACFGIMEGVEYQVLNVDSPFVKGAIWTEEVEVTSADRVIIFTKSANDKEAMSLAKKLDEQFIPFAAVASEEANDENLLSNLAYTYISLKVRGGLLPHPEKLGERIVFPHLFAALYVYEAVKMAYDEMIGDILAEEEKLDSGNSLLEADEVHGKSPFA